ncbi:MAG: hypothetical protein HRT47_00225 [Candidatus Caenarcaniphilales bacterium]|nr:hypothetical protein [Candidatus Caenarcaniphilales bacterium]
MQIKVTEVEAYIFGEKEDGSIILLAKGDNGQLGKIGQNIQTDRTDPYFGYHGQNTDVAHNDDLSVDVSSMRGTGRAGWNGANNVGKAQEFKGTMTVNIGDTSITADAISINRKSTPLILDLNDDGLDLSSHEDGAHFDLTGDGLADKTAWTKEQDSFDDAFLVWDRNGDGEVNSGKELFGDQHGEADGFDELAKLDSNNDGVINADDRFDMNGDGELDVVMDELKLWADMDADGKVGEGEMKSLAELGLTSIDVTHTGEEGDVTDEFGNDLSMTGGFTREVNGETIEGTMTDVLFVNRDIRKDEVQSLDDISAYLEKKVNDFTDINGEHIKTLGSIPATNSSNVEIRLSSDEANNDVQRLVLENDLAEIDMGLAALNTSLVNEDGTQTQNPSNNQVNNPAGNSDSNLINGQIDDLQRERASILGRIASLNN